eukprot:CAMPEP_0174934816 /NCGR_PEP_ID=MMETSP1355-20121228/51033_1 /TAXON_ID=464990 /ORGANISM="Hemiselmis tepida, Strain CCMP443" /LENGTH=58 /DNA_ID=CAMNT_0016181453 /DNA_START=231 /DNA_END=408 /DNA_ORIENTATION=-
MGVGVPFDGFSVDASSTGDGAADARGAALDSKGTARQADGAADARGATGVPLDGRSGL